MPWPSASRQSRGYGRAWDIKRAQILRRDNYLCQCKRCAADGRITPANEVDHIVPKAKGGTDDDDNLQAINHECHERKSLDDRGVTLRPTIGIDGWPVAGG